MGWARLAGVGKPTWSAVATNDVELKSGQHRCFNNTGCKISAKAFEGETPPMTGRQLSPVAEDSHHGKFCSVLSGLIVTRLQWADWTLPGELGRMRFHSVQRSGALRGEREICKQPTLIDLFEVGR
jgi:hypothetical protein